MMRISGLASGMDIDSMVTELMKAKRASYDKMVQKRIAVEWAREDYRSLSTKIVDFRNNKLTSYNMSNALQAKKAELSGNTDSIVVNSATASAAGSFDIEVTKVAQAARTVMKYTKPDGGPELLEASLNDLGFEVDNDDKVNITINGKELTFAKDTKIKDLVTQINSDKTLKVTALASGDTISITSTQTGKLEDGTELVEGFPTTAPSVLSVHTTSTRGNNATVLVNGVEFSQESNQFSINGFNFTAKSETGSKGASTITAVLDTDKIISTIKSFVNDYNTLIAAIDSELSEERYRTYLPLTDEQKKEMSEDEVKLWQEKARSGSLRNDTALSSYLSELRIATHSLIYGIDTGEKDSANNPIKKSVGITSGSYSEKGKLYLDEDALRKALDEDPSQVAELFTGTSNTSSASTESGVFSKMMSSSMTILKNLSEKAGTSLTSTSESFSFLDNSLMSEQIRNMKTRETDMLARLATAETNYYKVFTAMETAINKYNSQSSSLSGFMS